MRPELLLHHSLAPLDPVVVITDADDLDRPVQQTVVTGYDRRLELDSRRFPHHMRRIRIGDIPLSAAVDPGIQAMRADHDAVYATHPMDIGGDLAQIEAFDRLCRQHGVRLRYR